MNARKTLAISTAVVGTAILASTAIGMNGNPPRQYLFAPNGANKLEYIHWLEGEDIIAGCLLNRVSQDGSSHVRKAPQAIRCMRHYHVLGQFKSHFLPAAPQPTA